MKELSEDEEFRRLVRKKTLKSFFFFFAAVLLAIGGYKWLVSQPEEDGALKPFRKVLEVNAKVFERSFDDEGLSKEFPKQVAAKKVRFNGSLGLRSTLDTSSWMLKVVRYSSNSPQPSDTLLLGMDDLRSFPKTEVIFNFKCIEGWSQVSWWGGVKFSDLAGHYKLGTHSGNMPDKKNNPGDILKYAGLVTPDGEYYVGIDMPSMFHPQTILAYEMNGQALKTEHGAPLRLIIPVKYGIKHLKRIGTIFFSDEPPRDYWALRGYDYFAGL